MPADMRPRLLAIPLALALLAGAGLAVAQLADDGRIGPDRSLLDNGRHLTPYGKLSPLGNFPTGGRVTPNGRFFWTVSTGRGAHHIRVISVRTGKVLQTLPLPGASGGIAMDPKRPLVYVSGVHGSNHQLQAPPAGGPAAGGRAERRRRRRPRLLLQPALRRRPVRARDQGAAAVERADAAELPADQHQEDRVARPSRRLARRQAVARPAQPRRRRGDRRHRQRRG